MNDDISNIDYHYLNEYVCLWNCILEGRKYRVKRYSERCCFKIEELDNLADKCNELQDPLNKEELKKATIRAAEICQGNKGKKTWTEYLQNK